MNDSVTGEADNWVTANDIGLGQVQTFSRRRFKTNKIMATELKSNGNKHDTKLTREFTRGEWFYDISSDIRIT